MIELGELEKNHAAFAGRSVRLLVASSDSIEDAKLTQAQFPHLTVIADAEKTLIKAADVMHPGMGPHGEDIAAPTTLFLDRNAIVRSIYRPKQVVTRLSPHDVLGEIDRSLGKVE